MPFQDILYEVKDSVAWITFNKPDKLNAMSWGTHAELESAIHLADHDDGVKCVVLTGAGRGFSAGTDLMDRRKEAEWPARPYTGRTARLRSRFRSSEDVYYCSKPTIAAVNGVAVGAGLSIALACDIRIASEKARFSAIFVKRAIVADTGSTWFLPRLVGMEHALKMLYTGRMVEGPEALQIGLVSELVPHDDLIPRATALAHEIASGPSLAIELNKRLAQDSLGQSLAAQIEREEFLQQITHKSEDREEGMRSFVEKRDPVFKGR